MMEKSRNWIKDFFWRLCRCCLIILFLVTINLVSMPKKTLALLRQHHEAPGVLRYHSQVSIKDDSGLAWQVVLYKKNDPGTTENINLRLVGFPDVVKISHPRSLEILTQNGKLLSAVDAYAQTSPAPNVGEYKLTNILNQLATTDSLELYIPLQGAKNITLKIPSNVVTEWQWLLTDFS